MRLAATLLLFLAAARPADQESELSEFRERAESIIKERQQLEITTREAQRKVQLLLKDLRQWSKDYDVELETRTRTYGTSEERVEEMLTADRCPLFYEEELHELCPLDLARSEVWGGSVVFCRYLCE